jgi:cytochrome c peroxidase
MHTVKEIRIDYFQANRSPDKRYRRTPLRELFIRTKGGFYHDGRFPDLAAVVVHYNKPLKFNLTEQEKRSLIEYLKSL